MQDENPVLDGRVCTSPTNKPHVVDDLSPGEDYEDADFGWDYG